MVPTKQKLRLSGALLLVCLTFIWGNSLLPGEISGAISDWVKELLSLLFSQEGGDSSGGWLVRKLAHFTEFACLGAVLSWRFAMKGRHPFCAWLAGTAAAGVDETIQLFVPDRGPGLRDVAIDSCGVAAGLLLFYLGLSIKHHFWRNSP